jgi:Putative zinc-finger
MSKCRYLKKQISRYIDNDLDDSERRWLESHMALCEECTRVYTGYTAMKNLVRNSYAGHIPEMTGNRLAESNAAKPAKQYPFSVWNVGTRLAAMILLGVSLYTGIFIFLPGKPDDHAPLVIESESCPIMNSPLGALVYYEELAGKTVHTQYLQDIKEYKASSLSETSTDDRRIFGYQSPLFCDSLRYLFE